MAISPVDSAPAASSPASSPEGDAEAEQALANGQAPAPTSANGQARANGQAPADPPDVHAPDASASAPAAMAERACANCGAALAPGQDWCLQCGAGAPGSLGTSGWHPAAVVAGVVAVLVLGAAAAAYAALNKGAAKGPVVTTTVAQAQAPTATTPTATNPGTTLPVTPGATATTPKAAKGLLGLGGSKPPKIPLTAVTPKSGETSSTSTTSTTGAETKTPATPTTPKSTNTGSSEASEESKQAAILLDPDAASTYNPYELPASSFGDPSRAIDGDPSTAWTAQVNPATAPKMAEGLLIDLKSEQKVSVAQLITSTPGMTIQFYGTTGQSAPTSITDPAWTPLSRAQVVKKKHLRVALRDSSKAFTFIVLWISQAPQSSVGTAQAPGHVDVNELELFPAS